MTFGHRMKEARKEQGMTQDELGTAVGTTKGVIGKYERDEISPTLDVAIKIANALGRSLDYLGRGITTQAGPSPQIQQRINILEKLPTQDKNHILAVIDAFEAKFTISSSEKSEYQ